MFTRFARYNEEPADLDVFDLDDQTTTTLVSKGRGNVNLPGSSWNAASGRIVFSSSREPHDEIYVIDADGRPGDERRITDREGLVAYEPSMSPDGATVVFESHVLDVRDNGWLMTTDLDGSEPTPLTDPGDDCRQPNWSPAGDWIVYQRKEAGQWDLWLISPAGGSPSPAHQRSGG